MRAHLGGKKPCFESLECTNGCVPICFRIGVYEGLLNKEMT